MSVEIILRDDIADFEPKPMFGFSYRQIATIVIIILAGYFTQGMLWPILGDFKAVGGVIMLESALIGLVGFGKFKGLRAEQYMGAAIQDFTVPARVEYVTPVVLGATDKALMRLKAEMTKAERQRVREEKEGDELDG